MKIRTSILLILVIGSLAFSCNDINEPENQTDTTRLIEASLKPYLFKTGSFWIFENDSTGSLDSIVVISTEHDSYWCPPPVHGAPGQKHEYYKITKENFSNSEIFNDFMDHSHIRRNGGGSFGELGQPIFMAGEEVGAGYNGMEIIDIIPKLVINGNTFTDVSQVKITATEQYQQEFEYDTYLYFTDSIGIIKQEVMKDSENIESWSLKRWTVEL